MEDRLRHRKILGTSLQRSGLSFVVMRTVAFKLDLGLQAKSAGIQNILALRGDPPKGEENFTAVAGGFSCALDLVKYIRYHSIPRLIDFQHITTGDSDWYASAHTA